MAQESDSATKAKLDLKQSDSIRSLISFEKNEFFSDIQMLEAALEERNSATFDSLKFTGHLSFLTRSNTTTGKYTMLFYDLRGKHNHQNWDQALKETQTYPIFIKLYDSGFFQNIEPVPVSSMVDSPPPSPPIHDAEFYLDVINNLFAGYGAQLKGYGLTLAKYKTREYNKHLTSAYKLAFFRKSFIYHIKTAYGIPK